jgi:4-oxalocrotonate tautomerase
MPHVIVKMYPGRSEELKNDMVSRITKVITDSLGVDESAVSVALEEIERENWKEAVYKPDIMQKEHLLYKARIYAVTLCKTAG